MTHTRADRPETSGEAGLRRYSHRSLSDALRLSGGRPTGFDYMRIVLAVAVVCWHSIVTSYGGDLQNWVQASWYRPLSAFILPMFFCLSGFLVAGSLERCPTMVSFLGLRFIRIYPALAVEVLLSAIILGPMLTTVPLASYLSDPKFLRYLVNVTGHISYQLPGVFLSNPSPDRVNGQLWTVPFELLCYATIAGLALLGLVKRRNLFVVAVIVLWATSTAGFLWNHPIGSHQPPSNVPGYTLIVYFLAGIGCYLFRDRMPYNGKLAILAAIVSVALFEIPMPGDFLAPLPIAYVTVYIGSLNPRKLWMLQGADYSYGIFLYGYAVQQAWMSVSPALHHWYLNLALTLPSLTLCAAGSWYLIEKPALRLRHVVKALEGRWMLHRHRFLPHLARSAYLRPPRRDSD